MVARTWHHSRCKKWQVGRIPGPRFQWNDISSGPRWSMIPGHYDNRGFRGLFGRNVCAYFCWYVEFAQGWLALHVDFWGACANQAPVHVFFFVLVFGRGAGGFCCLSFLVVVILSIALWREYCCWCSRFRCCCSSSCSGFGFFYQCCHWYCNCSCWSLVGSTQSASEGQEAGGNTIKKKSQDKTKEELHLKG